MGSKAKSNTPKKPPKQDGKRTAGSSSTTHRWTYAAMAAIVALAAVGLQVAGVLPVSFQKVTTEPPPRSMPKQQNAQQQSKRTKPKSESKRAPTREQPPPEAAQKRTPIDPNCKDDHESCEQWARGGECSSNPAFMEKGCRASCHICNGGKPKPKEKNACEDSNANCATWAAIGECQSNPGYMLGQCPVTCKMCQSATCRDDLDDCPQLCRGPASSNFSDSYNCYYQPELVEKCAWTCGACKEHRFHKPQCKRDAGAKAAALPGSVNKIFKRIVDEVPGVTILSSDPWILTIDNFLTSEESDAVLKAGSNSGTDWARSQAGDGVQAARTSSTAWCKGKCLQDPTVRAVEQRVSSLLGGIPMENAEPMQVLRYEEGQFYKVHHDQNSPRSSAWGPRMFTVFMYIGDGYGGGETHFPKMNLTVSAKKGAACVWTSILDSDPYQRDDRTDHESLPVASGVKFGVNYWIHMWPFRSKSELGCGNQAYVDNWY